MIHEVISAGTVSTLRLNSGQMAAGAPDGGIKSVALIKVNTEG